MRSVLALLLLFRCGQCMKTVMRGGRDPVSDAEGKSADPAIVPLIDNRVASASSAPASSSHIKETSHYDTTTHQQQPSSAVQRRIEQSHPPRPPSEERIEIEIDEDENDEERSRMTRSKKVDKYPGAEKLGAAFGRNDYLLPENFKTLRRQDIPVTYRLHDDLLRYYRKGTRPVKHPNQLVHVSMSVFLYQIIKLDAVKNTISLSGSFELLILTFTRPRHLFFSLSFIIIFAFFACANLIVLVVFFRFLSDKAEALREILANTKSVHFKESTNS